jgi:hypothetical protein
MKTLWIVVGNRKTMRATKIQGGVTRRKNYGNFTSFSEICSWVICNFIKCQKSM